MADVLAIYKFIEEVVILVSLVYNALHALGQLSALWQLVGIEVGGIFAMVYIGWGSWRGFGWLVFRSFILV